MLEKIIQLDKELFIYLNSFGSEQFDGLWLLITKQIYWTPFFILVFYFLHKKIGWKYFGYFLLFLSVLILVTDQTANLFKWYFQRLRPCNDDEIKAVIRIVKTSSSYSFFSAHAANSMATAIFVFQILKKYYKNSYLLFLFPIIFAYSRIYLGVHFPSDILVGYLFGGLYGYGFYKLYEKYIISRNL